jgi:hypothetical protein
MLVAVLFSSTYRFFLKMSKYYQIFNVSITVVQSLENVRLEENVITQSRYPILRHLPSIISQMDVVQLGQTFQGMEEVGCGRPSLF